MLFFRGEDFSQVSLFYILVRPLQDYSALASDKLFFIFRFKTCANWSMFLEQFCQFSLEETFFLKTTIELQVYQFYYFHFQVSSSTECSKNVSTIQGFLLD